MKPYERQPAIKERTRLFPKRTETSKLPAKEPELAALRQTLRDDSIYTCTINQGEQQ